MTEHYNGNQYANSCRAEVSVFNKHGRSSEKNGPVAPLSSSSLLPAGNMKKACGPVKPADPVQVMNPTMNIAAV
jgi:hypothetical protein